VTLWPTKREKHARAAAEASSTEAIAKTATESAAEATTSSSEAATPAKSAASETAAPNVSAAAPETAATHALFLLGQFALILLGRLYQAWTGYDVAAEVRAGNFAAGISFAMTLAALSLIILKAIGRRVHELDPQPLVFRLRCDHRPDPAAVPPMADGRDVVSARARSGRNCTRPQCERQPDRGRDCRRNCGHYSASVLKTSSLGQPCVQFATDRAPAGEVTVSLPSASSFSQSIYSSTSL